MRNAVFLIAGAQAVLLLLMALWPDPPGIDAAGRGMAMGYLMVFAVVAALFLVPAVILALTNRALKVALLLSLVPPVLALVAMGS